MKRLNDLRMWQKQLLSCILVFLIPFSVCFYLAHSMKAFIVEDTRRQAIESMERVVSRLQNLLSATISTSSYIAFDNQVIEYVTTDYADTFSQIEASWKNGNLSSYLINSNDMLDGFFFFCESPDVLNTGFIKTGSDSIRNSEWYRQAVARPLVPFWAYTDNDSFARRGKKNLTLCRSVYHQNVFLGVLCVYVNEKALNSIVSQEEYLTFVYDPALQIVASSIPDMNGKTTGALGLSFPADAGSDQITYLGEAYDLFMEKLAFTGIQGELVVNILYNGRELQDLASRSSRLYYLAAVISGLVSLTFMLLISRLMSRRLDTISRAMHAVAEGDFSQTMAIDGHDEIGRLSDDLNTMVASLHRLIQENYQITLEKQKLETYQRDIQLQLLNNQINPHFLFNTLESIRMMSVINGQNDVSYAIQRLSSLMRRTLYLTDTPILLREELMCIEDYLSLQKLRLGERLVYQININGNIEKVTVLPFLIQPIVENVIKHGLDANSGKHSYVIVDINCTDKNLIVNVADNGVGMSPDTVNNLQAALLCDDETNPQNHIGIRNVNKRIHLFYGSPYSLSIQSNLGIGTIVTITIPKCILGED